MAASIVRQWVRPCIFFRYFPLDLAVEIASLTRKPHAVPSRSKGIIIMRTILPYCVLLASVAASLGQSGGTNLTITVQPQSQTLPNGGTAIFSVTATGPSPLNYTW